MFFILQTIIISIVAILLVHQIIHFISKPAPKIKFSTIEKYKSLLENSTVAAAAAAPHKLAPAPAPLAAALPPAPIDITNELDIELDDDNDDTPVADDESVYSAGFSALKEEMEGDLLRAISQASAAPPAKLI